MAPAWPSLARLGWDRASFGADGPAGAKLSTLCPVEADNVDRFAAGAVSPDETVAIGRKRRAARGRAPRSRATTHSLPLTAIVGARRHPTAKSGTPPTPEAPTQHHPRRRPTTHTGAPPPTRGGASWIGPPCAAQGRTLPGPIPKRPGLMPPSAAQGRTLPVGAYCGGSGTAPPSDGQGSGAGVGRSSAGTSGP